MKILVYIPTASFFVGGGEVVPLTQARYLSKIGHQVRLAVLKVRSESEYFRFYKSKFPDIKVDYLPSPITSIENQILSHQLGHLLYLKLTRTTMEYCQTNKFDIAITHYSAAAFSIPHTIPQILYLHGIPGNYEAVNDAACYIADHLVAVSQSVADGWKQLHHPKKKIEIIRNGIDEHLFCPSPPIPKDIDILYVGRLIEIKGVQHLLQAVSLLPNRPKNVVICGDGPYKPQLTKLTKQLKLTNVTFTGYLPSLEIPKLYNSSKITVFPSFAKEGVLTTMLEAAACGCCIVTADCCGMAEFIRPGHNGLLFKPQNPKDLASKLNQLLSQPNYRIQLGRSAHQTIIHKWTWDHAIRPLNKIIQKHQP